MNETWRSVAAFMAAGLALALVVGVVVWNASTPDRAATAGYTATETSTTRTTEAASSARQRPAAGGTEGKRTGASQSRRSSQQPRGTGNDLQTYALGEYQGGDRNMDREPGPSADQERSGYRMDTDPYAPPHAVTGAPKTSTEATVYRPTNVRPADPDRGSSSGSPASETGHSTPTGQSTPASPTGQSTPASPTAPSTTPAEPGTPGDTVPAETEPSGTGTGTGEPTPASPSEEPTPAGSSSEQGAGEAGATAPTQ